MAGGHDLDLARLQELPGALGSTLPEIVSVLVSELSRALSDIDDAIAGEDLAAAAHAAHAARNSALMVDARPLLDRLAELERYARRGELPAAVTAHRALGQAWTPLRAGLERAARDGRETTERR
ncbi:MAG: Hpt domain-containing protein [Solirubrobacteraceae bacterium]